MSQEELPLEYADDVSPSSAENPSYATFVEALGVRVREHFEPAGTDPELIKQFIPALVEWIDGSLAKFANGQREHGGDIRDRDLDREIMKEMFDLQMYVIAKRLQRQTIELYI